MGADNNTDFKGNSFKRMIIFVIGALLIICIGWCFPKIVFSLNQDCKLTTYENSEYHISLKYCEDWKQNYNYSDKFEGKDGFFQINALSGRGWDIDDVAKQEVSHQLVPYGSNPQISELTIQGQEGRLIMPSSDQIKEMNHQAEVVVKYPKPIEINGSTYNYFILYADKDHIQEIAKTIRFTS